jgi:hypothetical protein
LGRLCLATLLNTMMFWHAIDHGETVASQIQLRTLKLLARASVAAQISEGEGPDGPSEPAQQLQLGPDGAFACSVVHSTLPEGHSAVIPQPEFVKDSDGGWTWGKHPGFTPEQQQRLEEVVGSRRQAFAYSIKEQPGYSGDVEPMRIVLKPEYADKPIFEPPRRHSYFEYEIQDEKFGGCACHSACYQYQVCQQLHHAC